MGAPFRLDGSRAALADGAAVLAFAVVGLLSHGHAAGDLPRVVLPFLGCWYAAAAVTRLYRRPSARRLLGTWAVGVPAGVLVRALLLGRALDGGEAAFLGVALAFTLLFVLVARAVVALLAFRGPAGAVP